MKYGTVWLELAMALDTTPVWKDVQRPPVCTLPEETRTGVLILKQTMLGRGVYDMVQENLRLLELPENQALLRDSHKYYTSLQTLKDAQFFWDPYSARTVEMTEEEEKKHEDRFVQLYKKFYSQVVREADVIIASCHQAGAEVLIQNFRPTTLLNRTISSLWEVGTRSGRCR